jgi:CPA1 family monovalent cation:H+ antiporter
MSGVDQFELILGLLVVTVALSAIAHRIHMPPAAAFVLGGMALAIAPGAPAIEVDPGLIMVLFLPPLLLSSAYFTSWRDFRAQLRPILMLAVGAVAFTTFAVGWAAKQVMPELPWAACFALGAIVSPPDAVSAKAVLQGLRLPRRLVTILEGESLINDASGLVLYRFAVAAALSGTFSAGQAAGSFVWLAVGGIAVGAAFGFAIDLAYRRMRDPYHVIISSFLVAWLAYIAADRLEVSGVLSVVSCGLVMGWFQHERLSAQTRTQAFAVWQMVEFVLEALVFVLIGLSLRGVLQRLGLTGAAFGVGVPLTLTVTAAAVVSRFIWVYAMVYLPGLRPSARRVGPVSRSSIAFVASWAGMRGVVSLAAALALPEEFPGRDAILLATFGVILATVLLQGTTLGPLARALRLTAIVEQEETLSEHAARAHVMAASAKWLENVKDAETGAVMHPLLLADYNGRARATARMAADEEGSQSRRHAHFDVALQVVDVGRAELIKLHRAGKIHDSILKRIEAEFDLEELHLRRLGGLEAGDH